MDFFSLILDAPNQTCPSETQTKIAALGALSVAEGSVLQPRAGELLLILGRPNVDNPQAPGNKPLRLDWGKEMAETLPQRFLYDMNTLGGNSGSPVIARARARARARATG